MHNEKNVSTPSQCELILAYMRVMGSITARQAMNDIGCMRLASRIHDLRSMGYNITTETIKVRTRHGKTSVARYRLDG